MQPRTAAEEAFADRHIARERTKIQATWTDRERYERARWAHSPPMTCPVVPLADVQEAKAAA